MKVVLRAMLDVVCCELETMALLNCEQYEKAVARKNEAWEKGDISKYLSECSACSYHYSKINTIRDIVNKLSGLHDYNVDKDVILK